jgi:Ca2+-binding EF-hand superfamily protein
MSTISGVSGSGDAWAAMKAQKNQMQEKMFAKVDTDSSGGVDKSELQGLLTSVAQKTGVTNNSSSDELFSKMDSNSDGSLSSDELDQGMQSVMPPPPSTLEFAQSRSEDASGAPPPPGGAGGSGSAASSTYDPLDINEDGTVSAQERMAASTSTDPLQTLFEAIDANGDSQISSSESDTFIQQLTSQLDAKAQNAQDTGNSASTDTQATQDGFDLAQLVTQAYEQIASGLAQQASGSRLSALA